MRLSEDQRQQVLTLLSVGMRQIDCAAQFQISKSTIHKIARSAGIRKNSTDPLSPEMERRVIELAIQGHGEPYIAKTLAVPGHRVRGVLHRHVLARTGSSEPRERLSLLEERLLRSKQRRFEEAMATEFAVSLEVIQRLLRRRRK